eukprot:COSAG02_NODE_51355_length_314_cov_1.209302_1_plen_34_part_01
MTISAAVGVWLALALSGMTHEAHALDNGMGLRPP